ncbi:MAG: glutamate formimidoyltransferase [Defluviitaleaceae bacterium]|nr:glutamate formimidoyltransferase [Defluviitaleaceae bacterium]MCL2273931.1 glutamate formimidoyltransferase [Defluviitaleaceae bacterium]
MTKIIECIPNFSEGQRMDVVEALADAAKSIAGVTLLDYSADASHNRSVFTLIGDPQGIKAAAITLAKLAAEKIDLTRHEGEHPRMGATDVIPFVPIKNATMEECVELAKEVGEILAKEINIPVYLYEEACSKETRRNLANVRKGQFEGMAKKMAKPEWRPDFGDAAPHPTAGVTAVGARMPLVAFNVNLSTGDVEIANNIAKVIRGSGGGLKYCKAIGIALEDRNIAQVSMNIVNYEGTPLYRAVELIKAEAKRYGVHVIGTELIGLTPVKALTDSAEYYLQLENFDYNKQVLENHLW